MKKTFQQREQQQQQQQQQQHGFLFGCLLALAVAMTTRFAY